MEISTSVRRLRPDYPFTTARGMRDVIPVVIVRLHRDGLTGLGEASPSARYGENVDTVQDFIESIDGSVFSGPAGTRDIFRKIDAAAPGNMAAKAALDTALHDWVAQKAGVPLWQYFGLNRDATPVSSFTIGLDTPEVIERKVADAGAYPVLKVKLGGSDDREIVRLIRRCTSTPIRVDVNEGWEPGEEALETALWLEEQGVELIEQPFPAGDLEPVSRLKEHLHIPLLADESFGRARDLEHLRGVYDGINVKLMKCGGPGEALRIMEMAREMGLKVMIGCMIETSVGISAAAHLSPLADYADLDGNLLISNDPYTGAGNAGGRIILGDKPGLGIAESKGRN